MTVRRIHINVDGLRWQALIYVSAIVLYLVADLPPAGLVVMTVPIVLLYLGKRYTSMVKTINWKIALLNGPEKWPVHTRVYPLYKFVDIYRAAQAFVENHPDRVEIRSSHVEPLSMILSGNFYHPGNRTIKPPEMVSRKVSYAQEVFLPTDTFWLLRSTQEGTVSQSVIRVRAIDYRCEVHLEVASKQPSDAIHIIDTIMDMASRNSIYRNRLIGVVFDPELGEAYDEDDKRGEIDLVFLKEPVVTDADIVLDDQIKEIVERTIVDFHNRREELMSLGLPGKRGVLFYGPPGTGKTYTSKYLSRLLKNATTIVATGRTLVHIKSICNVAKMLQPSLVILEDVDLVFSEREINAHYNIVLGEFMDQLDGFTEGDQVTFVLTTNAIERVEAAIKDRPGRISQCVYFGPPSAELRQRYFRKFLRNYGCGSLDIERIVSKTEGVSQAFIKELVYRAVQVASSARAFQDGSIELVDDDFAVALSEMTSTGGWSGKRIIGFHTAP